MAIIEPTHQEIKGSTKGKKYASSTRFWHWLNLILISGSLLTVLINSTLFEQSQRSFIRSELISAGASVSNKQIGKVMQGLEEQVWFIHIYFGFALAVLFLFRLMAEFFLPPERWLMTRVKEAYQTYINSKKERKTVKHELMAKVFYIIFYLLLLIMVVTGLLLALEDYTGIPENINHSIKEFHGSGMYLILAFIVIHLAGVFLAERKDGKGIVSDMINGGEN